MTKGIELALRILTAFAVIIILFIVVVLVFDDDAELSVRAAFWFFGACATLFFSYKKLTGTTNNTSSELDVPAKKLKSSVLGIVAVGLGLASVVMPYFAAVFFVPAAFIRGAIAFRQGDRKFGGIAVVLAIVGVISIISVSNQIGTVQRDLERSLRSLR